MRFTLLVLACSMLTACSVAPAAPIAPASTLKAVAAAVPRPSRPELPSALPTVFSHLPPGTYQVHLHSICSGSQSYHLAFLPNLDVGSAHSGQVLVPTSDFGRGWCVIVYADSALNVVLATQPI